MKKLVLKSGIREMLSKNQMKQITGGSSCSGKCWEAEDVKCEGTSCHGYDYTDSEDGECSVTEAGTTKWSYCDIAV